jgi:hypothetical protein
MVKSRAACICMHAFFNSALFLLNCHLFRAWAWRSLLCFGFWVLVLQYIRVINDSFFYIDVSSATAFHASGIQRDRERERGFFLGVSLYLSHPPLLHCPSCLTQLSSVFSEKCLLLNSHHSFLTK